MTTQGSATSKQPQQAPSAASQANTSSQRLLVAMALAMSWRLALVVVVPILAGNALDKHYHLFPWLTLAGSAVAAVGVFGVMLRTVSVANAGVAAGIPKRGAR